MYLHLLSYLPCPTLSTETLEFGESVGPFFLVFPSTQTSVGQTTNLNMYRHPSAVKQSPNVMGACGEIWFVTLFRWWVVGTEERVFEVPGDPSESDYTSPPDPWCTVVS